MPFLKPLVLIILSLFIAACSGSSSNNNPNRDLELNFSEPTMALQDGAKFSADIAYGDDPLQAFDIFLPDSEDPTPLIIYIHGGGFTGGDKADFHDDEMADHIHDTLAANMAYASINYRLLQDIDDEGVIKSLNDTKRALQFIRYHAEELNIDKEQIALYGVSAGAGASLWLGLSDEMADDGSTDDLIDDESTRVQAVGAIETQGSYDLVKWETEILKSVHVKLKIAEDLGIEQRLLSFYGMDDLDDLYDDPEIVAYRARVDLLALMDADDPDLWIRNYRIAPGIPLGADPADTIDNLFHHPLHAKALLDQAEEVGIAAVGYVPELEIEHPSGEAIIPFLVRHIDY